ncbi:hypothetical protein C5N14_18965 [Micromonospora sp. MW-13]|uniref:hypothetical protein n=2 Tax=unclassified Micromonospora TaxID=2617518 RepID=UPI000E42D694|nr:hypothetical protein [Micromonospora sp. MW-13]RGC67437.1 hypothetical protein C5N14_18965 [Micromonospora sp. MW-13]
MTKARREFERGTHQDDLPFLGFVTDHEMTGVQGTSFLVLGNPERAAQSFRAMTMDLSPSHRRNQLYYTTRLAEATYKQGDVNEAARIGMSVLPAIGQVSSGRVSRHLAQLRSNLGRPQGSTATTREFVDAYAAAAVRP